MANQYDKAADIKRWTETTANSQFEIDNIVAAYARVKTALINLRGYFVSNPNATFTAEDITKLDAQIAAMKLQISNAIA